MKTIFTLVLSLILYSSFACSFSVHTFCMNWTSAGNNKQSVFYGRVVDTISNGIRFELFDVLQGTATLRDTVNIWNADGMRCTDSTMGPVNDIVYANTIGAIGDTAFVIVQNIDSAIYTWDVVGEYRVTNILVESYLLKVNGGIVSSYTGYISGHYTSMPQYNTAVQNYPLEGFLQYIDMYGNACDALRVGVKELTALEQISIYPNPSTEHITITNLPLTASVELISISGQTINTFETGSTQISTAHLAAGTYLLKIKYEGETGFRRIVKL